MPISRVNKTLLIPMGLVRFVQEKRLLKPFFIFLYLKCYCTGKISIDSPLFKQLIKTLGIKDRRTFTKHFKTLLRLNWIGFDQKSGTVFVRSFERLRVSLGFKSRTSVVLQTKHFKYFREFLSSAIIGSIIKSLMFLHETAIPRKLGFAPRTKDGAKPNLRDLYGDKPEYYGLSLLGLAEIMGCSKTKAVGLKKKGIAQKFIKAMHHYEEIKPIHSPDYYTRPRAGKYYPEIARKMIFLKSASGNTSLVVQQKDEIWCNLKFKKRKKLSKQLFKK